MGTGAIVKDVMGAAGKEAAPLAKGFLRDEIAPWFRSMENELNKTETGKILNNYIKNKYEPEVARMSAEVHKAGAVPHEAVTQAKKAVREKVFLKGDKVLQLAVHSAAKERGLIYANSMADSLSVYLHESDSFWRRQVVKQGTPIESKSTYFAPKELEVATKKGMSWMFTSRIAIPHLSQPFNLLLSSSIKSVAKGVSEFMFNGDRKAMIDGVIRSGALMDEFVHEASSAQNKTGGWFNDKFTKMFHQPFFSSLRKQQIILSAVTGKHLLNETFDSLLSEGKTQKNLVNFKLLGLDENDVNELLETKKLSDRHIDKAMFRMASEVMFIRSGLETPSAWDRNALTRFMFMYKSYPFREGKFITQSISRAYKAEGTSGVMKQLAILATVFPAAGEFIKIAENIATGQRAYDPNDPNKFLDNEYIDAVGHVAGFGVGYAVIRSAQRRGLHKFVLGPIISTGVDLVTDGINGNTKGLARTGLKRISWVGMPLSHKLLPTEFEQAREKRGDKPIKHRTPKHNY